MAGTDIDWFIYFLHPEKINDDFSSNETNIKWKTESERKFAALEVLRGLFGTANFKQYILSAYPLLNDKHNKLSQGYSDISTPPSTPVMSSAMGAETDIRSIPRPGQCSVFSTSNETGLPFESLATVLNSNALPPLCSKQLRLLSVADELTILVGFNVEDIERTIHATIRFIYYLHLLETFDSQSEHRRRIEFEYRRWIIRSAYREEEVGLTLELEVTPSLTENCLWIESYASALDCKTQTRLVYSIYYDIARFHLSHSDYKAALKYFVKCQEVDPEQSQPVKFKYSSSGTKSKLSVNEYIEACNTIVTGIESTDGDVTMSEDTDLPELPLGSNLPGDIGYTQYAKINSLVNAGNVESAMRQCIISWLKSEVKDKDMDGQWMLNIDPRFSHYCAQLSYKEIEDLRSSLLQIATEWVHVNLSHSEEHDEHELLQIKSRTIVEFITPTEPSISQAISNWYSKNEDSMVSSGLSERDESMQIPTIVENQDHAIDTLSFEPTNTASALIQMAYRYLAGLRLMELERYRESQTWFERAEQDMENFKPPTSSTSGPIMASAAEKEEALRSSLMVQAKSHGRLASVFAQINSGTEVSDLWDDISWILESQVPIRFEFLEHLVLICLRQDNKSVFTSLVGTIATNPKLYQQLPEIHIALLQVASMLVVIRDMLFSSGIDIDRITLSETRSPSTESSGTSERSIIDVGSVDSDALSQIQKSVVEVAMLLLKVPVGIRSASTKQSLKMEIGQMMQKQQQRLSVGMGTSASSATENEIEKFCRMWGDPVYLTMLGILLSSLLLHQSIEDGNEITGNSMGPESLCKLVDITVHGTKPKGDSSDTSNSGHLTDQSPSANGDQEVATQTEASKRTSDGPSKWPVPTDFISTRTEKGRKNNKHLSEITLMILKYIVRTTNKKTRSPWLYFSELASIGGNIEQFMPIYMEFLALETEAFSPLRLSKCIREEWFQQRLPKMIQSLVDLGLRGAAVVLHQIANEIDYEKAIPLLVQAFEKNEMTQKVSKFIWDPNIVEYGQYLASLSQSHASSSIVFTVPCEDQDSNSILIISEYFVWLAGTLSSK